MDVKITPGALHGTIEIPPSKSAAHRAAICAALAEGESALSPVEATADMLATISALKTLGAQAEFSGGSLKITGIKTTPASAVVDCGESGSTLRFILPIAAALGVKASFRGRGRLPMRPMDELIFALGRHGISFNKNEGEILSCSGKLEAGAYEIGGATSSQYVTGLLMALPLLRGDSEIILTAPLESSGYVDMTCDMLGRFGVHAFPSRTGWEIPGGQRFLAQKSCAIESDYSSAAFWLCGGALGGFIEARGLDFASKQGDKRILEILAESGADIEYGRASVRISRKTLRGFDADVSQIPDLTPALAVFAAFSDGTSRLYNARRLRLKESDRIMTTASGLRQLGAEVSETSGGLAITGRPRLSGGGIIDSFGDHRIAMSMSIGAAYCGESSVVMGAECADKSYPGFYRDFAALGGILDVI